MVINYSELKKILIIRLSSIGDVLLATPLIRAIKKKNSEIQIDFVLKEEFFELVQNNPHLSNIYIYKKNKSEKKLLLNSLLSSNYELVIDLQNNLRSREITRPLKCKIVRFKKNGFSKFILVHLKINKLKEAPQIPVRYAKTAQIDLDTDGLDFFTAEAPDPHFNKSEKYIGLCPGAKHFTKRWPMEYYIELGKKLETAGYHVALFGGSDEVSVCSEIGKKLKQVLDLCNTSILQVGADMKMCKAIYTNDSGLMHLASSLKVPVIVFFGSTTREFGFFPYKARSIELENLNLSCRPCTHIGRNSCPKIHFKCLSEIKPDIAFKSLNHLLASK